MLPVAGATSLMSSMPSFSSAASSKSESGNSYGQMNSPFMVGGSAQSWTQTVSTIAPMAIAGLVAWLVLKK